MKKNRENKKLSNEWKLAIAEEMNSYSNYINTISENLSKKDRNTILKIQRDEWNKIAKYNYNTCEYEG